VVAGAQLNLAHDHAAPWLRWRYPAVRDLAWAIGSPPLLRPARAGLDHAPRWLDQAWCDRALAVSRDWLDALDHDPAPLRDHLARARDHRLGSYFEDLLAFWLTWPDNPLYALIARNLPVRHEGRTLGEFDFLVRERASGETQHWEVAVKFFLGVRAGGAARHWIGPGLRDRLDLKLARLRDHQLRLADSPAGRDLLTSLGLPAARPVCLVKGRLFYPACAREDDWTPHDAAPGHLRGWWLDHDAFRARWAAAGLDWLHLPRAGWMTEVILGADETPPAPAEDIDTLLARLPGTGPRAATGVVGLRDGREVTRGFVVPPDWPPAG